MNKRELQESEYGFPYHHIPQFGEELFSETRHLYWGYEYASYLERILELLTLEDFDSLIDVGCGDGRLLLEIHKKIKGKRLVGTDFSEHAVAFAKAFGPEIDFRSGTFEKSVYDKELFSFATLIEVLEHIPPEETDTFLRTFDSFLTPGGRGIITVPSKNIPVTPKHFRHFDEESLRKTLEPHFTIISIEYLNAHTFGEKLLRRIFANRLFILNEAHLVQNLYRIYKKLYLHANSNNGQRLLAVIKKKIVS